mmetsp:Transcript_9610/g.23293  ORF Transcript_9610/g.23293 Transcript_9610/m.23293 type:complete len:234 (+) Transcript_9610:188-889(+)
MPSPKRKRKMWGSSSSSSTKKSRRKSKSYSNVYIDEAAAEALFAEFADEDDPTVIEMDGIVKLCEQLDIDPESDVRILVLLWKLGSKEKPAQITKEEFMGGCNNLEIDTIEKLKSLLPSLDTGFLDQDEFKSFYKFCFQFNRQGTHKTLDKDMVVALWNMLLKGRIPDERLDTFCTFTEIQKSYTRITLDQWTSFLDFCHECEDLSTYDESTSAWPVLIDDYVEYMEEQQKKK